MKRSWKGFVVGFLVACILVGMISSATATTGKQQAYLEYNDIKISLNGSLVTPKDADGNIIEPFTIDGTTYLPVRAVGNALGLTVGWDQSTKTVILTNDGTSQIGASAPAPKPTTTPTPTPAPSQRVEVTVYVTRTGSKYHRAGCQYLRKSQISISLSDAIARGYTACSKCW